MWSRRIKFEKIIGGFGPNTVTVVSLLHQEVVVYSGRRTETASESRAVTECLKAI